jgi:hypothetical protein
MLVSLPTLIGFSVLSSPLLENFFALLRPSMSDLLSAADLFSKFDLLPVSNLRSLSELSSSAAAASRRTVIVPA